MDSGICNNGKIKGMADGPCHARVFVFDDDSKQISLPIHFPIFQCSTRNLVSIITFGASIRLEKMATFPTAWPVVSPNRFDAVTAITLPDWMEICVNMWPTDIALCPCTTSI